MNTKNAVNSELRNLPSVDELLRTPIGRRAVGDVGTAAATEMSRTVIDELRSAILAGTGDAGDLEERAARMLERGVVIDRASGIQKIINATGVIIHTNLGRAPLAEKARQALLEVSGYATVEYDLLEGKRGRRGARTERLIAELTRAEDALVVNNCAAAAFFVLTVFASGGEVVISRGELVEIGGDFRVPDVLEASGATLREVGTTNRTKLADYERAVGPETRMLLRVHPSNYRIHGFTAAPERSQLAALADSNGLVLFEDAGSGALVDLSPYGLVDEPVIRDVLGDGVHLTAFSGDKLLGGPQCGIIAGRKDLIDRLRKHPLQRALRVDKKTFAALEATLEIYRRGTHFTDIPVLRQIAMPCDEIADRARRLQGGLREADIAADLVDGSSVIGGGSAPDVHPRTSLVALRGTASAKQLERKLRMNDPPIITRIGEGQVLIDLRTVDPEDDAAVLQALAAA